MTICESLLLSRMGIEALPYSVLIASALTMFCNYLYSRWVGKRRHEHSLLVLLFLAVLVIAVFAPFVLAGWKSAYVGIFAFHFVTFSLFTGHLQTLSTDYFDTLAAKRIMPLIRIGATLGEVAGGFLSSAVTRMFSLESLLLAWAGFLILAAVYTQLMRSKLLTWNPKNNPGRSSETEQGGRVGEAVRRNPLSYSLLGMTVSMALTMAMVQYVVADVFVQSFPDEAKLASFLGLLTAFSNILELLIAAKLTPKLIGYLGVGKSNAVHALGAFLTLLLLWHHYTFWPAVLAWLNRKLVRDAIASPVRQLVYNAIQIRDRAALLAFVQGVVGSAAGAVASLFIFLGQSRMETRSFILWGLLFGAFYLLFVTWVSSSYIQSLKSEVASGRISIKRTSELTPESLEMLWQNALQKPVESELQLLSEHLLNSDRSLLLEQSLSHPDDLVVEVIARALSSADPHSYLSHPRVELRLAAARVLCRSSELLVRLQQDPDPQLQSIARVAQGNWNDQEPELLRYLPDHHLDVVLEALGSGVEDLEIAALERLAGQQGVELSQIFEKTQGPSLAVGLAALDSLSAWQDPLASVFLARNLSHSSAKMRSKASRLLSQRPHSVHSYVKPYLRAKSLSATEAAYDCFRGQKSDENRVLLAQELRLLVKEAWKDLVILARLPATGSVEQEYLVRAMSDRAQRCQKLCFRVLSLLEGGQLVTTVVNTLQFSEAGKKASALELLSNLGDREAAALLVLLLEDSPIEERLKLALSQSRALSQLPSRETELLELCAQSPDPDVAWTSRCLLEGGKLPLRTREILELSQFELLSNLTLQQLTELRRNLISECFAAGEMIIESEQKSEKLYFLREGQVSVDSVLLGAVPALGGGPALVPVVALSKCRLWSLDSQELKALVNRVPAVSFSFIRHLARRLKEIEKNLQGDQKRFALVSSNERAER